MQRFEVTKPLKFDLIEFYKFQLGLFIANIPLTDTQKSVIVYFYLFDTPIEKLVEDKVFKTNKSAQNYVSDLRKPKLLIGKGKDTKVNPAIRLKAESFQVTLNILLNK